PTYQSAPPIPPTSLQPTRPPPLLSHPACNPHTHLPYPHPTCTPHDPHHYFPTQLAPPTYPTPTFPPNYTYPRPPPLLSHPACNPHNPHPTCTSTPPTPHFPTMEPGTKINETIP
ncbi:hypothetical protein Pcinc_028531, partial [Petrolisthes cinctipes]